ncbi:MAG: maleylpyruvate isomerase N-terminal domain-containing protein [Acidimicrobiales bacterium]
MLIALDRVRVLLGSELALIDHVAGGLSDADLIAATGCAGWRAADVMVHLRMGAEAILAGLASPTTAAVDRDAVSYWRDWTPGTPPGFGDVRSTWAMAAAYSQGKWLLAHFHDMCAAAERAARAAPAGRVAFQGHVLAVEDFLAVWTVEFALHHADLVVGLPGSPMPAPDAIQLVAATLDGLLESRRPAWWDTKTYVRKGTGREPLDDAERARLADLAERYPAFG